MPSDVVVRHCTLTVQGQGGWGWGTDCSGYLAAAIPAIEQALERVLGECDLDPGIDVRIEQPLRLSWQRDGTVPDEIRQALADAIRLGAEHAGAVAEPASDGNTVPQDETSSALPATLHTAGHDQRAESAVTELLATWSQSGRLRQIVASWPDTVVAQWLESVRTAGGGAEAAEIGAAAASAVAELVLAEEQWPAEQTREGDRLLVLVGALVAAGGVRPIGPTTLEHAARLAHSVASRGDQADATHRSPSPASARNTDSARTGPETARPVATHAPGLSRRISAPGLPFLIMVQLGRIGYLQALAAVAEATGTPGVPQVIAAGLAGKVLPPAERGWRRRPLESEAVAAASGLAIADIDSAAHALWGQARLMLSPLQSALIALYAEGRSAADEVVVTSTPTGVVCGEAEGALPVAWLPDLQGLDAVLEQLGRPPLRHADLFEPLARELDERSAFPHLDVPDLERQLGAVVGTALGSLAQELWGADVPNAPLMALDRLADLEVELRLDDVLAVAIPRGQRWLDLGRAGLLDRWGIPWAQGGYWELVSW